MSRPTRSDDDSPREQRVLGSAGPRFGRRTLLKTTTTAALAAGGLTTTAAAQPTCDTDVREHEAPGAVVVSPRSNEIVTGSITIQVTAADDQDDDETLAVEVSIGGGDWIDLSYNDSSGYFEHELQTSELADDTYEIVARVTDGDGNVAESQPNAFVVKNDIVIGVLEDFEREDPLADYGGDTDDIELQSDDVYHGEQAIRNDSGGYAGIAHTEGHRENLLPSRGDEVHFYFKNARRQNFLTFHLFAQDQEDDPDGYTIGISGSQPAFILWVVEDGNLEVIDSADFGFYDQIDGWYRAEVRTDNTTVYTDLYDDEADQLLVSLEAADTTFGQGGIGFRSEGNGEIWDTVVMNPQEERIPSTVSTPEPKESSEPMPGFGLLGGAGALLGAGYGAARLARRR